MGMMRVGECKLTLTTFGAGELGREKLPLFSKTGKSSEPWLLLGIQEEKIGRT